MYAHLSPDIQRVAEFQYLTGMRTGNVLALQWAQIDLTTGVMRLEGVATKNGELWTFPFDVLPPLARLLRHSMSRRRNRHRPWSRSLGQSLVKIRGNHGRAH